MTERDIPRIEKAIGRSLPPAYVRLVTRMPRHLLAILNEDPPEERLVFTDARTVIHWNRFFHEPGREWETIDGEMVTHPPSYFVFGGGVDFFNLDLDQELSTVYEWSHETGLLKEAYRDLGELVRDLYAEAGHLVAVELKL